MISIKKTLMLAAAALTLTACPAKPDPEPIDPIEQKNILEETALKLINAYPSDKFDRFTDVADRFCEEFIYDDDYDWSDVEEYLEEKGEDIYFDEYEEKVDGDKTHYDNYTEFILQMSDIEGQLVFGKNAVTYADYDGTQALFSLDGKDYVAEIVTSGKTHKAIFECTNKGKYEYDYGYGYSGSQTYDDEYYYEVEVPEHLSIKITEDGQDLIVINLDFTLSFSRDGLDSTKDCFIVTMTFKVDDQEIVIEKTGYDASTGKAYVSYAQKQGGATVIRAEASAKAKFEIVTEKSEWENGYDEYTYPEFTLAKDVSISIDVLGDVQIKGSCSDILSAVDYMDAFYESEKESAVERALANLNNIIDLGIYYYGNNDKQADIVMDYYIEDDPYYDNEWYEMEPIMVFSDGSQFAFDEYFTESSFRSVVRAFENWLEDYVEIFE